MSEPAYILIVEQSATQASVLRTELESHGFSVEVAADAETALALMRERAPQAVISDIVMPPVGGFDLCKAMKADPKLRDIVVILLTSLSDPADVLRGLEVGADLYLAKPHHPDVLFSRLTALLDTSSAGSGAGGPPEVIVVEDSPDEAFLLSAILSGRGYNVRMAENGNEALALMRDHLPDVVVSDVMMPEMDGYELCRTIKEAPHTRGVPVVLVSSLAKPGDIIRAIEVGADHYFMKPYEPEELVSQLQAFTSSSSAGREGGGEEITYEGQEYMIRSERNRILGLLIATYENSLHQNQELTRARRHLEETAANLEKRVTERTAELAATVAKLNTEIADRMKTEEALVDGERRLSRQNQALIELTRGRDEEGGDSALALREITATTGRTLNVERASIWLFTEDRSALTCIDLFQLSTDSHTSCSSLQRKHSPAYFDALAAERVIGADDALTDPRTKERSETYAAPLGISSTLDAVIQVGGRRVGVVCCEQVGKPRNWKPDEESFAGSVADLVAVALESAERRSSEETQRGLQDQLRQSQKMEAVGQLAGGMAHDLNNYLTVVVANTEMCASSLESGSDQWAALQDVLAAAQRGTRLVKNLLAFCRRGDLVFDTVDPRRLIEALQPMLRSLLPENIDIQFALDEGVPSVVADPGAVEQILLNLATNARDAMSEGGTLEFALSVTRFDEHALAVHDGARAGEYICIAASDTGTGMDAETLAKVFEPFFTTKPRGTGTGLGMAMTYGLVVQHGGFIHPSSEPGKGTTIRIYFPVAEVTGTSKNQKNEAGPASLPRGDETILVVEDDESLRRTARRVLESLGYQVIVAEDGEAGLVALRDHHEEIALVISDLIMPKMGGVALREAAIRELGDTVRFLFVSGYDEQDVQQAAGLGAEAAFLHKPWTVAEFAAKVRNEIDAAGP